MKKKFSIVPDILKEKGIEFFDESGIKVELGPPCIGKPDVPIFEPPFIMIDTFAKKSLTQTRTRTIDIYDLDKLDCEVAVIKVKLMRNFRRSFSGQQVLYFIQKKSNRQIGARSLSYIPGSHWVEYDESQNKIRLRGRNAGSDSKMRNTGKWFYLSNENNGKEIRKIRRPLRRYLSSEDYFKGSRNIQKPFRRYL